MNIRHWWLATCLVLACGTASAQTTEALLDQALAGPQRSAANQARDVYRHPRETLLFFGLRPDQAVIEIAPGGGWYTEILAPVLRERGRLYAAHYPADGTPQQRSSRSGFQKKLQDSPAVYGRVTLATVPKGDRFTDLPAPGGVDLVLTFRSVHNWIEAGHLDATLKAFYDVLKPGGVLGVEEHRSPVPLTTEAIARTGYVPEALVIERAQAAGFQLAGRAEINANPRDTRDHPNGVWSLPPSLRGGDTDRARFLAIGESDRMTLKFVKPKSP